MAADGIDEDMTDYYLLANLTLTVANGFDVICQDDIHKIMFGCHPSDYKTVIALFTGLYRMVVSDFITEVYLHIVL